VGEEKEMTLKKKYHCRLGSCNIYVGNYSMLLDTKMGRDLMSAVKSEKAFFISLAVLVFIGVAGPCIMFFKYNIGNPFPYFLYTLFFGIVGFLMINSQVVEEK